MAKKEIINWTSINIKMFTPTDTLYIKKMDHGFGFHILCKFVKVEKGIVTGEIITPLEQHPPHEFREIGRHITARITGCYLWGKEDGREGYDHCIWFNKDGFAR